MSGGSLDYAYFKVEEAARQIARNTNTTLHKAFVAHLYKVAQAMHDIEWVIDGDMSNGDDIKAIEAVISKSDHLVHIKEEAENILKELKELLKEINNV